MSTNSSVSSFEEVSCPSPVRESSPPSPELLPAEECEYSDVDVDPVIEKEEKANKEKNPNRNTMVTVILVTALVSLVLIAVWYAAGALTSSRTSKKSAYQDRVEALTQIVANIRAKEELQKERQVSWFNNLLQILRLLLVTIKRRIQSRIGRIWDDYGYLLDNFGSRSMENIRRFMLSVDGLLS